MVPTLAIVPPLSAIAARGNRLLRWIQPVAIGKSKSKSSGNGNGHGNGNGNGHSPTYRRELVTMADARSLGAESFRTLRTNLLFSSAVQSMREVIVTSSAPSEGKSTTAANLAVAFAQQGQRVLLVDCDLRRPQVHLVFGFPQIPGLTTALMGGASPAELVHGTAVENLAVLTAGPTPPNPAELLGGARMRDLLDRLSESYELIILDTPPVLVASDAAILSRHAGGTLLVVRAGKTQAAALREALQQLAHVGTRVIGTVLNDPDGAVAKFSSYYGSYFDDYQSGAPARV
jgi:capsular exopolysaccharide synthesis family protein